MSESKESQSSKSNSFVTRMRNETDRNRTSSLKNKFKKLHNDSEIYDYNPKMGMTTVEQAQKYKKLQDDYVKNKPNTEKKGGKTHRRGKNNRKHHNKKNRSSRHSKHSRNNRKSRHSKHSRRSRHRRNSN